MASHISRVPLPRKGSFWSPFVLLIPALIGTPLVFAYRWIVPEPFWLIGVVIIILVVISYCLFCMWGALPEYRLHKAKQEELEREQDERLAQLQEDLAPASLFEIEELVSNAPREWRRILVLLLADEAQQGRQFSKGTIGRLNDYVHGRLSLDETAGPLVASDGLEHGPQADFIMKLRDRYDRSW